MRVRVDTSVGTSVDEADADEVWPIYAAVWPETDAATWRRDVWQRHAARPGFRLARAHDGERLVGLAYGYVGERGQWWADRVAETLPASVAEAWLGGHFEVVSVGVLADARGQGIGRQLMTAVCDVPHDRLLLQTTDDAEDPARRLYARLGWEVLGPGAGPGTVVMGREPNGPRAHQTS